MHPSERWLDERDAAEKSPTIVRSDFYAQKIVEYPMLLVDVGNRYENSQEIEEFCDYLKEM